MAPPPPLQTACAPCDYAPTLWFRADSLYWWTKRGPAPGPLVSTGPPTDDFPGALDQPNSRVLFGNSPVKFGPFAGLRITAGLWLDEAKEFGFEVSGFGLEKRTTTYALNGNAVGQPFIARPFVNADSGAEDVFFVSQNFADPALTALMTGKLRIANDSRLYGYEANATFNVMRDERSSVECLSGSARSNSGSR